LKYKDYKINEIFYTDAGKWKCTDIGSRIIVAISLDHEDERNYNGPPYSIQEVVFDEYDFEGCFTITPYEWISIFRNRKTKI